MSNETKAPQPPAEAQQQGGGDLDEVVCLACGDHIMPMGQVCHACSHPVSEPPSAPVGVEDWLIGDLMEAEEGGHTAHTPAELCGLAAKALKSLIAQQPAVCPKCDGTGEADSGGIYPWGAPATIPCDCQQPAAVDEAMVFRLAVWMAKKDGNDDPHHLIWEGSPPEPWGEVWNRYEDDARSALTAALAAQQRPQR